MVFSVSIAYALMAVVVVLAGASLGMWVRGRPTPAMLLLMGAAFGLRLLLAGLDPYLHDWDERFHALVARNMLTHPFEPMLRAATWYPYEYQAWCCNHIWLHKQPLFLWQIALSLKLFGVNELALRLPSVVLSSLVLWPVYRLGYLAFGDRLVGYLGALLAAFAHYQVEQVAGAIGMDHNDSAFLVYVTGSIWAYYEYRRSSRPVRWLVLVGVLAGAAILCKWLTGMLVYAAWGLDLLLRPEVRRRPLPEVGRLLASVAVAVALMLPWQLYTAWRFPQESAYERAYNARHFSEALEGHGSAWTYHFDLLPAHYGLLRWLMLLGIGLALWRHWRAALPLLAVVALVYGFFSVAATKMYSYTYVASLLLLLLAALPLAAAARWLGQPGRYVVGRRVLAGLGLVAVLLADLRPWGILAFHFEEGSYDIMTGPANHPARAANAAIYRQLAQAVPAGCMVFNAVDGEDLEAMFFSGRDVYAGLPTEADVRALKAQGICVAVYPARAGQVLPPYLQTPDVVQLWGDLREPSR